MTNGGLTEEIIQNRVRDLRRISQELRFQYWRNNRQFDLSDMMDEVSGADIVARLGLREVLKEDTPRRESFCRFLMHLVEKNEGSIALFVLDVHERVTRARRNGTMWYSGVWDNEQFVLPLLKKE